VALLIPLPTTAAMSLEKRKKKNITHPFHLSSFFVGDTHIVVFLFAFLLEKILGFVFKEILITQT